ncbi:MAG: hypothetical protein LH629_02115 [Ignavibacteria bacterium]|nr:hypothetical protein [Ignavibacteria bacterium]
MQTSGTESITQIRSISEKKLNRKKFFVYAGSALAGFIAITHLPFSFFKSNPVNSQNSTKTSALKITANPNAVKRNSKQINNELLNNG